MTILEYFIEAAQSLAENRLRSILTAFGLTIGVFAVITIEIVGNGTAGAVTAVLRDMNDRTFTLSPAAKPRDLYRASIRLADIRRVNQFVPNVVDAFPSGGKGLRASFGHTNARISLGPTADERFATATPLAFGRKLDVDDVDGVRQVAVISATGYKRLGITDDPTGRSMRIGQRRYVIVGVLKQTTSGILPSTIDYDVSIPYTTYEREYAYGTAIVGVRFLMNDASQLATTEQAALDWVYRLKGHAVEFQTFDRKVFSQAVDRIFNALTLVLSFVGAISLVVAGVGVLNIMMVTVSERTSEIGLRKAVGATRSSILLQFMAEAFLLSLGGCLIGLVAGVALGAAISALVLVKVSGALAPLPWAHVVGITLGFAATVTLIFGTYPAWRAARLDPIVALRHD